jgi:hypothetical protein
MRAAASVVAALAVSLIASTLPARGGAAEPLPEPSPTVPACAAGFGEPADFLTAYAYDITSPAILRFIAALEAVPSADQKPLFDRTIAAAATPAETSVRTEIAGACPSLAAIHGATRACDLVANVWKLPELDDDERFERFFHVVAGAVAALDLGDRLPAADRATALGPFSSLLAAEAEPSPVASGPCPPSNARVVAVLPLQYPVVARLAGTTGLIVIKVYLSDSGSVRYATLYNTLPKGRGAEQMLERAVLSAGGSTYTPETAGCVGKAAAYLFRADFDPR